MLWILKASIEGSRKLLSHFSTNLNNNYEKGFMVKSSSRYSKLALDSDNNLGENSGEISDTDSELRKGPADNSVDDERLQNCGNGEVKTPRQILDALQSQSDADEDEDERLTCWVCDRSFPTPRILERHKRRERHYGCGICESVFRTPMALEIHREEADHWSDDDYDDPVEEDTLSMDEDSDHIDTDNKYRYSKKECALLL